MAGRRIVVVVPSPAALAIPMLPPCSSMIFLTLASPNPVPLRLVLKNGSKTLLKCSGGIGAPLFRMAICTSCPRPARC